jgi:hypothetical protein
MNYKQNFIQYPSFNVNSMDFNVIDQLLSDILYSLDTEERIVNGTVNQLLLDFKNVYDSVGREVLHNIHNEFGIPKKLVRPIKMVHISHHLSRTFPFRIV